MSEADEVHPLVRGTVFPYHPGKICGFGDGFLCVPEFGRHAIRIAKITPDGDLHVYDDVWPWMNPPFHHPIAALHAITADGFEVLYVITNGEVRRFFVAEFQSAQPSTPTARSAKAIATPVLQWFNGTFGELFYGYARRPDFGTPSFFKCAPGLDPPGAGPNQSSGLSSPVSLALDADADELYVADSYGQRRRSEVSDEVDNQPDMVTVLDAKTLQRRRSFAIRGDLTMQPATIKALLILGDELFVAIDSAPYRAIPQLTTTSSVHVFNKSGIFVRVFVDCNELGGAQLKRSPVAREALHVHGLAVYPIHGVDHMLVVSATHVHVLMLPDGLPRQIVPISGAVGLRGLCVHNDRVYVSDTIGNCIHVLEGDCS